MRTTANADFVWFAILCSIAVLAVIADCRPAAATENACSNYRGALHWRSSVELAREGFAVTVSGAYAYVASGNSGVMVVSIANPDSMYEVGRFDTAGSARSVVISGDYAYVADLATMTILDITNPTTPIFKGSVPTGGDGFGVAVAGGFAYVAAGRIGMMVVDVNNVNNPIEVGSINTRASAQSILVRGRYAYVGELRVTSPRLVSGGLRIIEISSPVNPVFVNGVDYDDVRGLAISGTHAYLACDNDGFRIVDITDPDKITEDSVNDLGGAASALALLGPTAFIAVDDVNRGGFSARTVINPANPVARARVLFPERARGVATATNFVYVLAQSGTASSFELHAFRIGNATTPTPLGKLTLAGGRSVAIDGTFAYVATGTTGLTTIDISRPTLPVIFGQVASEGLLQHLVYADQHVFAASGRDGLEIFEVQDPVHPVRIASVDTPGTGHRVALAGNTCFIADGSSGLRAIDIAQPATPIAGATLGTPGPARGVSVVDGVAYVSCEFFGFLVADVSDPDAPAIVGLLPGDMAAGDVAVTSDAVYIAGGSRFTRLDIPDPSVPVHRWTIELPAICTDLEVVGQIAYLGCGSRGVLIYDLQHADRPELVSSIYGDPAAPLEPVGLTSVSDRLYVLGARLDVMEQQCSLVTPTLPAWDSARSTARGVELIWSADPLAYERYEIARAVGESPPLEMFQWIQEFAASAGDATLRYLDADAVAGTMNHYLLTALTTSGERVSSAPLSILHVAGPDQRFVAAPSPASGSLRLLLPIDAGLRLQIYSPDGRRIRVLERTPGAAVMIWDGRDALGRLLPAGVYLARVETRSGQLTTRVTLVR